ncbi:MAG: hypothetical protein J07HX64_00170 [halophilic archaeon J07HX64]|jgi:hypothetical protein|nr:MAG: hypothetical protein J07HX64_00170 [halophilic archaeon J07HX64]
MSDETVEQVLTAQPWRILRALRAESPRTADPVLRSDENLDGRAYESVCYELYHVLLPGLADDGFVIFDRGSNELRRGLAFETVRPLLDCPTEELRGLDAGPFVYDDGLVRYRSDEPVEALAAAVADHGHPSGARDDDHTDSDG